MTYSRISMEIESNSFFTDTDSLLYHIKTDDLVADLKYFSEEIDSSNYPKDHELYSEVNKKVIGKVKDEMGGKSISKFVGLKPKLYALLTEDGEKKRAKGVTRVVLKKRITFQDYVDCLNMNYINRQDQINMTSENHDIITVERSKIALSPLDDKRFWYDNINSYAFSITRLDKFSVINVHKKITI